MILTKNFTLEEMTHSAVAIRHNIKNEPNKKEIENLVNLAENVLQPLRDIIGKPIVITSGFRNPVVNKLVGGVYRTYKSQHTKGEAADFYVVGMDLKDVYKIILEKLDYDQAIYELGWIHISYRIGNNRNEPLVAYRNSDGYIRYKEFDGDYRLLKGYLL